MIVLSDPRMPIPSLGLGAQCRNRTYKTWFLRPVRLPIPSIGLYLVGKVGIEPTMPKRGFTGLCAAIARLPR